MIRLCVRNVSNSNCYRGWFWLRVNGLLIWYSSYETLMKNSKNPPLLLLHFYYRIAVQKTLKSSFLALHPIGNFQLPKTEKELKYLLQTKNSPYSYKTKPGSKTSFNYISNQSALDPTTSATLPGPVLSNMLSHSSWLLSYSHIKL